jgi:hypothetical protein
MLVEKQWYTSCWASNLICTDLWQDALLGRGRCTVAHGITVDRSKQLERTSDQEGEENEVCPLNCVSDRPKPKEKLLVRSMLR